MNLKTFFLLIVAGLALSSCRTIKEVPIETGTTVHYKDSTVVTYKDSTIYTEIPVERYVDIVNVYDTLELETSVAKARAWVDTENSILKGDIENKRTQLERIVYLPSEEHIVYKDSIVTKEKPVKVEVEKKTYPKTYWWLLTYFLFTIAGAGAYTYVKLKP